MKTPHQEGAEEDPSPSIHRVWIFFELAGCPSSLLSTPSISIRSSILFTCFSMIFRQHTAWAVLVRRTGQLQQGSRRLKHQTYKTTNKPWHR
jgi:hypothetical protein